MITVSPRTLAVLYKIYLYIVDNDAQFIFLRDVKENYDEKIISLMFLY